MYAGRKELTAQTGQKPRVGILQAVPLSALVAVKRYDPSQIMTAMRMKVS
jgi:hypothetical protein